VEHLLIFRKNGKTKFILRDEDDCPIKIDELVLAEKDKQRDKQKKTKVKKDEEERN